MDSSAKLLHIHSFIPSFIESHNVKTALDQRRINITNVGGDEAGLTYFGHMAVVVARDTNHDSRWGGLKNHKKLALSIIGHGGKLILHMWRPCNTSFFGGGVGTITLNIRCLEFTGILDPFRSTNH